MSQLGHFDHINERIDAYDLEQRTLFQYGVEDYRTSIVQCAGLWGITLAD